MNYTVECLKCGATDNLIMLPHRRNEKLVGWVFACPNCEKELMGMELSSSDETANLRRMKRKTSEANFKLVEEIAGLEAKLKAAEDYAETMEAEIKTLKSIGAEYWQTLCHYDHDGISTPWPYSTGGNRQSSAIKQLAESVPFAVFQEVFIENDMCGDCTHRYYLLCHAGTKQNCTLLKGKADE